MILRRLTAVIMLALIGTAPALSQTPQKITDKEVQQFATAFQQIQQLNQQAQQQMIQAIQNEDLEVARFTAIQQAQQNPEKEATATDEEMTKFQKAMKQIMGIQQAMQQKMEGQITAAGLTPQRYQQIAMQVQGSQELQQRIQKEMQKQQQAS